MEKSFYKYEFRLVVTKVNPNDETKNKIIIEHDNLDIKDISNEHINNIS